ncbi:Putative tRNA pseudouridine synthase Pus10 [Galdieria sulphuraria]|nr:Putative tRNA pseudouridine synthase Pus10 [Galdieria sulphuraria]
MSSSSLIAAYVGLENRGPLGSCCCRCCFRLFAVPCRVAGYEIYSLPENCLRPFCVAINVEPCAENCKLCLGLLSDQFLSKLFRVVQVKLQNYKVEDTFRISVAFWEKYRSSLQNSLDETQLEETEVDLKKCFKWTFGNWLETQLHMKFAVDSDLEIRIQVKEMPLVDSNLSLIEDMVFIVLAPIYLQGRYIKLSRRLSQSPWIVDNIRLAPDSIEECVYEYLLHQLGARECRFTAGGREDVDVRMLGSGRPFIIELLEAKCTRSYVSNETFLRDWERQVFLRSNGQVQLQETKVSDAFGYASLKESEMTKRKTYRCIVYISKSVKDETGVAEYLGSLIPLTIEQYTPLRVLHRRSLAKRKRVIHEIRLKLLNSHFAILDLVTDAGTYVKEFVHGDLGRTTPYLGSLLGCETDILQLDVLHVHISDWG